MADSMKRDWRELCLAVTNESDSTKLSSLVQELIEALDRGERSSRDRVRLDIQNCKLKETRYVRKIESEKSIVLSWAILK